MNFIIYLIQQLIKILYSSSSIESKMRAVKQITTLFINTYYSCNKFKKSSKLSAICITRILALPFSSLIYSS